MNSIITTPQSRNNIPFNQNIRINNNINNNTNNNTNRNITTNRNTHGRNLMVSLINRLNN